MKNKESRDYTIDAEGKSWGRVATETARILRGKNLPTFQPNIVSLVKVKVINLSKAKISGKKLEQKTYKRHSGYPGGLRYISMKKMMEQNPKMLFKKTVSGMLPKNKLTKEILKNLVVEL